MKDYYSELNLDENMNSSEINDELNRIERIWKQRRVTNPERAEDMLALVGEARNCMGTETALQQYKADLYAEQHPVIVDPDAERRKAFEGWKAQANDYYTKGQYDLAKTSMENALQNYSSEWKDADFLLLSGNIYSENKQYDAGLDQINKAIVLSPDSTEFYYYKAFIYEKKSLDQYCSRKDSCAYVGEAKKSLYTFIEKCEAFGNMDGSGIGYGTLSCLCYFRDDGEGNKDRDHAEEYAKIAVSRNDILKNGQKVLDDINKKRADIEARKKAEDDSRRKAEEDRIRRQKENDERKQKDQEYEQTINKWKKIKTISKLLYFTTLIVPILYGLCSGLIVSHMFENGTSAAMISMYMVLVSWVIRLAVYLALFTNGLSNGFHQDANLIAMIIYVLLNNYGYIIQLNFIGILKNIAIYAAIYIVGAYIGSANRTKAEEKKK